MPAVVAAKREAERAKLEAERAKMTPPLPPTGSTAQAKGGVPPQHDPRSAIQTLSRTDISELRELIPSSQLVVRTMQAVSILIGERPDWVTAKRMLGNASFLQRLLDVSVNKVGDAKLRKLEKYIQDPEFQEDKLGKINKAAKCLCVWVHGIYRYHQRCLPVAS